jgi:hypothetical protein
LRSPTFNPNYRDKVYAASEEDCSILKLSGELEVGRLRSESHLLSSVGVNVEAIPRMMGMFGMTGSGKTNTELILNAQLIDNSPRTVALIYDFAGQLLEGKEISSQRGLKDHPLFHSKAQYYSARDEKMTVGLRTLTPAKLYMLFPDIQPPKEGSLGHCTSILGQTGSKKPEKLTRKKATQEYVRKKLLLKPSYRSSPLYHLSSFLPPTTLLLKVPCKTYATV